MGAFTMRDAVEIILAGREAARRRGFTFAIDPDKMRAVGFSAQQTSEAEAIAIDIEKTLEAKLAALESCDDT
jgi:hypothetical protein